MSSDNQFTALGPSEVGFQTHGANINLGVEAAGNRIGVKGRCQGPVGDGVQGFGAGSWSGVAGFGGGEKGTGVVGFGGQPGGQGVRGIGNEGPNSAPPTPVGVYGQAGPGADGVQGVGSATTGAGAHGISYDFNGNGVMGEAHNGEQAYGVWGLSRSGYAGYFEGRVRIVGDLNVTGDLNVMGNKSAVVPLSDGSYRRLYALESPESWFEDFGFGELVDGRALIALDPEFMELVDHDQYHVFLTEYDANNALFVTNRTSSGFEVQSSTSPSNARFSYRVTAKRSDTVARRLEKVEFGGTTKSAELPAVPQVMDTELQE